MSLCVARTPVRYASWRPDDAELRERRRVSVGEHPRWGVPRIVRQLRREGRAGNHKRVVRLYRGGAGHSEVGAQARGPAACQAATVGRAERAVVDDLCARHDGW